MYTFCPNCFALYQVTASHLGKAGGQTCCGECRQVYRAVDYLYDELTVAREALATQRSSGVKRGVKQKKTVIAVSDDAASLKAATAVKSAAIPTHPARPLPDSWQQLRSGRNDDTPEFFWMLRKGIA